MSPKTSTSPGIQSLRFVAASSVVMDHEIASLATRNALPGTFEQYGLHLGLFGVWTFFLISGYIMIYAERKAFGSLASAIRFLIKRLIRIAPMYWIATLVSMVLFHWKLNRPTFVHDAICSFLFIPYRPFGTDVMHPILGQGWTLNYEMFFYVIFAACMLLPFRYGAIALVAIIAAFVGAGTFLRPLSDMLDPANLPTFLSDPIILLFGIGAIVCMARSAYAKRVAVSLDNLVAFAVTIGIFALAVVIFGLGDFKYPMDSAARMLFWPLAIAAVVICASTHEKGRILDRTLLLLGDASYCTYLFHTFVARGLNLFLIKFVGTQAGAFAYLAFIVVMANIVGVLIHLGLERPLTQWLRARVFGGAPSRVIERDKVPSAV